MTSASPSPPPLPPVVGAATRRGQPCGQSGQVRQDAGAMLSVGWDLQAQPWRAAGLLMPILDESNG